MIRPLAEHVGPSGTSIAIGVGSTCWAVGDDRTIQLGDERGPAGQLHAPLRIHSLACSLDDTRLLACPLSYDLAAGTWTVPARLDDAMVGDLEEPPPGAIRVVAGAFVPDGSEMVVVTRYRPTRESGSDDSYRGPIERVLLVTAGGVRRAVLAAGEGHTEAVAASVTHVAAAGSDVRVWSRGELADPLTLRRNDAAISAIAFDHEGRRLAVVAADGAVAVWNVDGGSLIASWQGHDGLASAVALHPEQPIVATGGRDGAVRLWTYEGEPAGEQAVGGWPMALAFDRVGDHLGVAVHARPGRVVILGVT